MSLPTDLLTRSRILVVDDDPAIANAIVRLLIESGAAATAVNSAEAAIEALGTDAIDLALVDIMLGNMSGLDLMRRIAERWPTVSIILMTGNASVATAVDALRSGAADYLVKPVLAQALRESIARALEKRRSELERREQIQRIRELATQLDSEARRDESELRLGSLSVDLKQHRAELDGRSLELTVSELRTLVCLMRSPGRAVEHVALANFVRGEGIAGDPREFTKRQVFGLRRKIEDDPDQPRYIQTVRGVGYKIVRGS